MKKFSRRGKSSRNSFRSGARKQRRMSRKIDNLRIARGGFIL